MRRSRRDARPLNSAVTGGLGSSRSSAANGRDDRSVIELVVREFTVDVALQDAWDHLARVENWTSWAKHIKRVSLEPPGALTDASAGTFRLAEARVRRFGWRSSTRRNDGNGWAAS